jgi:hypothetical protein
MIDLKAVGAAAARATAPAAQPNAVLRDTGAGRDDTGNHLLIEKR